MLHQWIKGHALWQACLYFNTYTPVDIWFDNIPCEGTESSAMTRSNILLTSCRTVAAAVLIVVLSLVKWRRKHKTTAWNGYELIKPPPEMVTSFYYSKLFGMNGKVTDSQFLLCTTCIISCIEISFESSQTEPCISNWSHLYYLFHCKFVWQIFKPVSPKQL